MCVAALKEWDDTCREATSNVRENQTSCAKCSEQKCGALTALSENSELVKKNRFSFLKRLSRAMAKQLITN